MLAGDDAAALELLSRYKSAQDAGKALVEQRKELSKRAAFAPLAADATPEQIAEHRKAYGVAEVAADAKPEAYLEALKIKFPSDYEMSEVEKGALGDYAKHAYDVGADPRVVQQSVDFFLRTQAANSQALQKQIVDMRTEWQQGLKKELGSDYDATIAAASHQVRQLAGDDATLAALVNAQLPGGGLLGDHPVFVRAMADLAMQNGFSDRIEANSYEASGKSLEQQQLELEGLQRTNPELYNAPATQARLEKVIGLRFSRGEIDEMGNKRRAGAR